MSGQLSERLEALFDVSKQLATVSVELDQVLSFILNNIHKVMGAHAASLMLRVPGTDELEFAQVRGEHSGEIKAKRIKFGEGISGEAAQTKKMINVIEAYDNPKFDPSFDRMTGFRTKQILTSPMLNNDEVVGVISVYNTLDERPFNEEDERILKIFCDQASIAVINAYKYGNLENIIEERTKTIKTILSNVQSGFFLLDPELKIKKGFSKSCYSLFGDTFQADKKITEFMDDEREQVAFEVGCMQILDDLLPEEVLFDQLPDNIQVNERILSIIGRAIRDSDGFITEILFTANDTSDFVAAEEENSLNRALLKILQNRQSFIDFVRESKNILASMLMDRSDNDRKKRSGLHTLKGNSSIMGLNNIARLIHDIEEKTYIDTNDIITVIDTMSKFLSENYEILKVDFEKLDESSLMELTREQVNRLKHEVLEIDDAHLRLEKFRDWLKSLDDRPAITYLRPITERLGELAERLDKSVNIKVEGGEIPMARQVTTPVIHNLVHVLRNALDHGLETTDERLSQGKSQKGTLIIRIVRLAGFYEIRVKDDGRGISVESLKKKAIESGLVDEKTLKSWDKKQFYNLIFLDGVSTAPKTTEISGRGVGMAALKEVIDELNGSIEIDSEEGKGTEFIIRFPDQTPDLLSA